MSDPDTSRISPTAHYTGYVWCKNGLSPDALMTRSGRAMFWALEGPMRLASRATGGMTLETMLLQRHLLIDHLLDAAIAGGRIGQVVEIAAGLSGRGWRMLERHRGLVYVESDLPGMADRKRRMLASLGRAPEHHVLTINALVDRGAAALAEATREVLDPSRGTAIITEGLLSYFSEADVRGMFRRFAEFLRRFPAGLYLSDVHMAAQNLAVPAIRLFRRLLQLAARGEIQLHFEGARELSAALRTAGFEAPRLHQARHHPELALPAAHAPDFVTVSEAWTPTP